MSKTKSNTRRRIARAGFAAGAATAVLVAATAAPALAVVVPLTLSSATGPSAGTPTITASSTTAFLTGVTAPAVTFSVPACVATYTSAASTAVPAIAATTGNILATSARKLTNNKLAVTVPAGVVLASPAPTTGTTKFNVCVYASSTANAPQIGSAAYSVATAAGLTSVSPAAAPSVGGSTVTVSGSNLPTTAAGFIGLSVGGTAVPAANINPVSSSSFSFIAPPHAPGTNQLIELTTAAGPTRLLDAFAYSDAVIVTPNTAPNETTAIDIDVIGSNFISTPFTGAWNDTNGHIYLVNGTYNPTASGGNKTVTPIQECLNTFVVSDTELICTLNLTQRLGVSGNVLPTARTAIADVVSDGTAVITSPANAAFTQADVGKQVDQTAGGDNGTFDEVPDGATIISVQSATQATLSANVESSVAALTITVGASRTVAITTGVTNTTTLVGASGVFSQRDVGRPLVAGGGIAAGTHITAVTGTTTATLSRATTGTVTTVDVGSANPVPDDNYTVTVVNNGAVGAQLDLDYSQSGISSGAAFTVADF